MFDLQALNSQKATLKAELGQIAHELSMNPVIPDVIFNRMEKLDQDIDAIEQQIREIRVREMLDKHGIIGTGRFNSRSPPTHGASQAKRPKIEDRK